jgi:hypothetical protein
MEKVNQQETNVKDTSETIRVRNLKMAYRKSFLN